MVIHFELILGLVSSKDARFAVWGFVLVGLSFSGGCHSRIVVKVAEAAVSAECWQR